MLPESPEIESAAQDLLFFLLHFSPPPDRGLINQGLIPKGVVKNSEVKLRRRLKQAFLKLYFVVEGFFSTFHYRSEYS
jgi:hypothetical protein